MRTGRPPEHGMSHTPEHRAFQHMHDRCYNEDCDRYPNYGGRGIRVCASWHDFENFYRDMGPCPDGYSLDREDVNGHYSPSNCRWADRITQANNTTRNQVATWGDQEMTVAQWARKLGIGYAALYRRLIVKGETFPHAARGYYAR